MSHVLSPSASDSSEDNAAQSSLADFQLKQPPPLAPALSSAAFLQLRRQTGAAASSIQPRLLAHEGVVRRLTLQRLCKAHTGCVNTIEFTAQGRQVLSGSDDQRVVLSALATGAVVAQQRTSHSHNIFAATPVPQQPELLVTAAADGEVHLVSFRSRAHERVLAEGSSFATVAKFLPNDSNVLVAAEMNGPLYLIDLRESASRTILSVAVRQSSTCVAFDPFQPWTMAYTAGRGVALYDFRRLTVEEAGGRRPDPFAQFLPAPVMEARFDEGPSYFCFSERRQHEMLINFRNEDVYTVDTSKYHPTNRKYDGRFVQQYKGRRNERTFAKQVCYFMDEQVVATGCDTGRITLWNRVTGKQLRRFKADHHIVNCTAAHPFKPLLISSGIDSDIKVWSLASNKRRLQGVLQPVAADEDEAGAAVDEDAGSEVAPKRSTRDAPSAARQPARRQSAGRSEEDDFGADAATGAAEEAGSDDDDDMGGGGGGGGHAFFLPPRFLMAILEAYRRELQEEQEGEDGNGGEEGEGNDAENGDSDEDDADENGEGGDAADREEQPGGEERSSSGPGHRRRRRQADEDEDAR